MKFKPIARASVRIRNMLEQPLTDYLKSHAFKGISARDCLVWLYIAEHGEKEYTTRDLAESVHGHFTNISKGIKRLIDHKLLEATSEATQGITARYKAIFPKIEK